MRKLILFQLQAFALLFIGTIVTFHSCVNNDYDLDNINKNVVFSQNGLVLSIGSLAPIYLVDAEALDTEGTFEYKINSFFSGDFYDLFVMDEDGTDRQIGGISFTSTIEYYLEDVDVTGELLIDTEILSVSGQNVGISFERQSFLLQNEKGEYKFEIKEEDMLKLKNAYSLKFTFYVESNQFNLSDTDVVMIKNMQFISTGGIHFKL